MNGQQAGDPAKLATALIGLIDSPEPPARCRSARASRTPSRSERYSDLAVAARGDVHGLRPGHRRRLRRCLARLG
jgi:hypothetical protein